MLFDTGNVMRSEAVGRANIIVEERSFFVALLQRKASGSAFDADEAHALSQQFQWYQKELDARNRSRESAEREREVFDYQRRCAAFREIARRQNDTVRARDDIRRRRTCLELEEHHQRKGILSDEHEAYEANFLGRYRNLHKSVFEKEEGYCRAQILQSFDAIARLADSHSLWLQQQEQLERDERLAFSTLLASSFAFHQRTQRTEVIDAIAASVVPSLVAAAFTEIDRKELDVVVQKQQEAQRLLSVSRARVLHRLDLSNLEFRVS